MNLPVNNNGSNQSSYWPTKVLKETATNLWSLGGKTAKLIGLKDLKAGLGELYKGDYSTARKSLTDGSIRLGITIGVAGAAAVAGYGLYKTAFFAQEYFQTPINTLDPSLDRVPDPSKQVTDVGECKESYNLKKWEVRCDEYHGNPELKKFIDSDNIYPAKVASHKEKYGLNKDAFDLKRNYKGDILVPTKDGYKLWKEVETIQKVSGLTATTSGYAPFGSPFSTKPTEGYKGEETEYHLDVNSWEWKDANPHPHNAIRLRSVGAETTTHSFGFYPEGRGKENMRGSLFNSIKGVIISPEPMEFGDKFRQTSFKITKEQYEKIKGMMLEDHGDYGMANISSINCTGFVQKALDMIGKNGKCFLCLPGDLGRALYFRYGANKIPARLA